MMVKLNFWLFSNNIRNSNAVHNENPREIASDNCFPGSYIQLKLGGFFQGAIGADGVQ